MFFVHENYHLNRPHVQYFSICFYTAYKGSASESGDLATAFSIFSMRGEGELNCQMAWP